MQRSARKETYCFFSAFSFLRSVGLYGSVLASYSAVLLVPAAEFVEKRASGLEARSGIIVSIPRQTLSKRASKRISRSEIRFVPRFGPRKAFWQSFCFSRQTLSKCAKQGDGHHPSALSAGSCFSAARRRHSCSGAPELQTIPNIIPKRNLSNCSFRFARGLAHPSSVVA